MKPIKPSEKLMERIEDLEGKKAHMSRSPNIRSEIVAISKSFSQDEPEYYIRADYFKDPNEPHAVQEYWQIRNINTPYFQEKKKHIEQLKELIEIESKMGLETSVKLRLKDMQKRYNFLIETRKISMNEMEDRTEHEYVIFLKRN